jgi:hypothetical protein
MDSHQETEAVSAEISSAIIDRSQLYRRPHLQASDALKETTLVEIE